MLVPEALLFLSSNCRDSQGFLVLARTGSMVPAARALLCPSPYWNSSVSSVGAENIVEESGETNGRGQGSNCASFPFLPFLQVVIFISRSVDVLWGNLEFLITRKNVSRTRGKCCRWSPWCPSLRTQVQISSTYAKAWGSGTCL